MPMVTTARHLADQLGADERTLRRAVELGTVRAFRPGPRKLVVSDDERTYLRAHWGTLARLRKALRTEPNVRLAVLFGSCARGDDHPGSDIDLLVTLRDASWRRRQRLATSLQDALEREVDLVVLEDGPGRRGLLARALGEGRILVDRDREWDAWRRLGPQLERLAEAEDVEDSRRAVAALTDLLASAG